MDLTPTTLDKPAKKAAATKTPKKAAAPAAAPKGPGRDTGSMLSRMKDRLSTEYGRLVNTETRALQHGDKAGAKRARSLADAISKVISKFD